MSKLNEYQKEYQQICKQTPRFTIGDCAGGHRGDNREKNRDVLVVPRMSLVDLYISNYQGFKDLPTFDFLLRLQSAIKF